MPAVRIDLGVQRCVEDSRQIFRYAAAGDMREPFDRDGLQQRKKRLDVNACWSEQMIAHRLAANFGVAGEFEGLADQRVAVRVRPAGRDADERIAGADGAAVDQVFALDDSDAKPGEIVVTVGIHVRHFRGLAADQCGAGLHAAFRNACNDVCRDVNIQVTASEIVEKKQRFRALHEHVIGAHRDKIDTDRVMPVHLLRELEFGADAVGARYEYRFTVTPGGQGEKAAKAAEPRKDLCSLRPGDQRFDALDESATGVDVNAGVFVGQAFLRHRRSLIGINGLVCDGAFWLKKFVSGNPRGRYNSGWALTGKPPLLKFRRDRRAACLGRHVAHSFLILLLTITAADVSAVEVASLYTAQVPLDAAQDNPRERAYEWALAEVLTRVAGSVVGNDADLIEAMFPNPSAYVVQFRPGEDDTLWVSFDGLAIEATLRRSGQTVWGGNRPLTMVWLAVDWGRGRREIIAAGDPDRSRGEARSIDRNRLLRERILKVAERRGLPIAFPLLDTEDLAKVSFSDIWGGFDERVLEASRRYEVDSVLIGRIRPATGQRNRWSYHFDRDERTWTGQPEQAIVLVADLLAAEFAIGGDAPLRAVELRISGITSIDAYGAMQRLLSGLNVIENFSITTAEGDRIAYRVEAHGGAERLARALRLSGLIEQDVFEQDYIDDDSYMHETSSALDFFYNP